MDNTPRGRAEINPHGEHSLLNAAAVAQWHGFALGWVEANPHVAVGDAEVKTTMLAMLDSGCAQAEFAYGRQSFNYDLTPGAIGLFTEGTHMNRIRWECQDVRRIIVEVDLAYLADPGLQECLRRQPLKTEVEFRDEGLAAVLRSMTAEAANGSPNGQLYAQSLSLGVAMRLQQRAAACGSARPERGKLNAGLVQRLEEWIGAHMERDISLAQLAQIAGFSPANFVRLFRNTMGCAPYHHVLKIRLSRARQLLLASEQPIATIAAEPGFSSQSHLTTAFMRAYNLPPGQMRRMEADKSRTNPNQ